MRAQSKAIAVVLFLLPTFSHAQSAREWLEEFIPIHERAGKKNVAQDILTAKDDFWKVIKAIDTEESLQQRLTGEINAGFNADDASSGDSLGGAETLYKFNSSLKLKRGTYPGELEFNSQISVTLNDGKFAENLSNFKLSFDHYFHPTFEGFAFADRFSDNFLSIDQRYEIGGGIVFDLHPLDWFIEDEKINLTEEGSGKIKDLIVLSSVSNRSKDVFDKKRDEALGTDNTLPKWFDHYLENAPDYPTNEDDRRAFREKETKRIKKILRTVRKRRETTINSIRKRYSRLRVGLLFGAFGELENATITKYNNSKINVPGRQGYRYQMRPTLHAIFSDELSLRIDYYLKEPFAKNVDGALSLKDGRRTDLQIAFEAKIKESLFGQAGDVTVGLIFRRLYDDAPPVSGNISARKRHDFAELI